MKLIRKLFKGLFFIFLGIFGGMLWQLIVLPYFAELPQTKDLWFVRNWRERKVVLYPKEEKIIRENEAITEAVGKVEKSVLMVEARTYGGTMRGSGLVLTSDGLFVTLADLLPRGGEFSFYVNGKEVKAELLEKDLEKNLALLRLSDGEFQTSPFGNVESVKKAERVFLVSAEGEEGAERAAEVGIVRKKNEDFIFPDIEARSDLQGSVLFNVEGKVLGINKIGLDNEILTIPISTVKAFAGL